jgi:hypothetical protein
VAASDIVQDYYNEIDEEDEDLGLYSDQPAAPESVDSFFDQDDPQPEEIDDEDFDDKVDNDLETEDYLVNLSEDEERKQREGLPSLWEEEDLPWTKLKDPEEQQMEYEVDRIELVCTIA